MADRLKGLMKRKRILLRRLPDLNGVLRASLIKRYLTCGRVNCKCQQGKKHGPFYYLSITLSKGKTKQIQIHPEQIAIAQRWIKNYRQAKAVLDQISQANMEILHLKKKATR